MGFVVALVALMVSERSEPPPRKFTFGWQRATLLGAFFNGVFLFALGVSILVQAIERLADRPHIDQPKIVFVIGCVGLGLNLLVMSFLHEHEHDHGHGHSRSNHDHAHEENIHNKAARSDDDGILVFSDDNGVHIDARENSATSSHYGHKHTVTPSKPERDLGLLGVFFHVVGDAINNVGVIIAALIIWKTNSPARYYADPSVGIFIAIMIFLTAVPLTKSSGSILMQVAPSGIDVEDIKHDIEMIDGIQSVHELHIWRLNQIKSVATAHIVVDDGNFKDFTEMATIIMECLHAYGIHSATLQPEASPLAVVEHAESASGVSEGAVRERRINQRSCQLICNSVCSGMRCCT